MNLLYLFFLERDFCKTGPNGGNDDKGKDDGDYAHPKHCDKYITCKGSEHPGPYSRVTVQTCPDGLFFNSKTSECDWPSNVDCFLYQGRTCFGSKNNKYGEIKASQTGYIQAMKVIHVEGYLTCKYYKPSYKSLWGCNTKEDEAKYLVNTWITTTENKDGIVFPNYESKSDKNGNYHLEGYNQKSPYLMWTQGPKKPTKVHEGDELRVWYGEDLFDQQQYDNDGEHCIDVYALFSYYRPHYYLNPSIDAYLYN